MVFTLRFIEFQSRVAMLALYRNWTQIPQPQRTYDLHLEARLPMQQLQISYI